MRSLRTLRLAGNQWGAPLDPEWGNDTYSWWAFTLTTLDLSHNPLTPPSVGAATDIPALWLNLPLQALYVSLRVLLISTLLLRIRCCSCFRWHCRCCRYCCCCCCCFCALAHVDHEHQALRLTCHPSVASLPPPACQFDKSLCTPCLSSFPFTAAQHRTQLLSGITHPGISQWQHAP